MSTVKGPTTRNALTGANNLPSKRKLELSKTSKKLSKSSTKEASIAEEASFCRTMETADDKENDSMAPNERTNAGGCTMKLDEEDLEVTVENCFEEDTFAPLKAGADVQESSNTSRKLHSTKLHSAKLPSTTRVHPSMKTPGGVVMTYPVRASVSSSKKKAAKDLQIPCPQLKRSDVELDEVVFKVVMIKPGMPTRQRILRLPSWTLMMADGAFNINPLRDAVFHLLHYYMLLDLNQMNPVDLIFKHMATMGHFVAGRRLISEKYFNFLDALSLESVKRSVQRVHEHFKGHFRDSLNMLDFRGKHNGCLSWIDTEYMGVLRRATLTWTTTNTFAAQQLEANREHVENGMLIIYY